MNSIEKIINYYDNTLPAYRKYWYRNADSYALHYGFWEKDTKNFNDSLINTNRFLADKLKITQNDIILDAGCGVGGSSIWLAKTFQAKVIGITLSEQQMNEAKRLAKLNGVDHLVDFKVKNYLATGFVDESFDIVWAIESVCHSERKQDFLKEAFRLLKHGGRLAVADGFQARDFHNSAEEEMIQIFNEGLALPNVAQVKDFKNYLAEVGFININFWDKTPAILNSAKRMYYTCKFVYPLRKLFKLIKPNSHTLEILEKNHHAGIVQYQLVKLGLGTYGVFYSEKP